MTLFRSFLFATTSIHLGIYMSAFGEMDIAGVGRGNRVTNAIAMASRQTGVDFNYLFNQAKIESGFNPNARASTSSATGLYQFIDQSWLGVVNDHGEKYGLGWAANAISRGSNGDRKSPRLNSSH